MPDGYGAGYTCSASAKKYTSCKSGYFLNGTGAGNSCSTCSSISATDLSQSCSRSATSTELSNAHAYAGTISGAKQQCTGKHTGGAGGTAGSGSCTGCSSWGTCSGGTLTITSCSPGYYLNGYDAGNSCSTCSSISATDLSQSCSRNPTSTELSNAHATAGTISGAKQQCTGKHTSGPVGATSASQCTGCSSWGSCSGGTVVASACQAGYYKNGNSCATCSSLGYTSSANGNSNGAGACYRSCTKSCTRQICPPNATCRHGSSSTSGTQYYGGSCSAASSTCSISISCNSGYYKSGSSCPACTGVSATDLSQSCSRNPTSTELSNAHATAGTISGAKQQCTGKHTGGPAGATSASQCTGCSSWGTCSGGTLTITSCSAGYYKNGNSCKLCESGYYCNNSTRYSCPPTSSSKFYSYNGAAVLRSPAGASAATQCYLDSDVDDYWTFEFQYKGFYRVPGKCYYDSSTQVYNNCENNKHFSECNAGYYINQSVSMGSGFTNSCTPCSPGTYTAQVGNIGSQAPGQDGSYTYATSCTACSPGTYNGATAATGCSSCTSISATDLSQSCSRSATSTELSNAHATAGTISGATQKCTGKHTGGPAGATSASQCTGCSSWGSCSGGTVVASACQAGYYKNGNSCEKCPTGYTSANGTTGGIGSCYINVSAGNYIKTANSSTQSTCTAGYWNPAHTVYYGNTSSCNKCTGATYSDTDGASSCKQCPTATEYAGLVTSYWYWTSDDVHNMVYGCRASFSEAAITGSYAYSCGYCEGDYGVKDGCGDDWCTNVVNGTVCAASYYNPNGNNQIWAASAADLKSNLCVSVGTGNWSGAGATAPTQCPDGYRDGPAATSEAGCAKNCISQSIVGGVNTPVSDSVNYPASCTYTTVCDDGYNLTGTNTCSQLCTLGVTSLRTGNGVTIPLYSSALSTPSLNIGTGGGVCYGILESGAGTLNIQYDGKTYHAVD